MSNLAKHIHLRPIAAGVLYGIVLRLLIALEVDIFSGLMSLSFFVFVPAAIGFLVVYLDPEAESHSPMSDVVAPFIAMGAFLLSTMLLMLEGSICVLIALPWFLAMVAIGGLVAGWLRRRRLLRGQTLSVVLLLPFVASSIEAPIPANDSHQRRHDTVRIAAPAEAVWDQITNVDEIENDELRFGLTRLLGVPRPVSASMDYFQSMPVRRTTWDKGVNFAEVITRWDEYQRMEWDFFFSENSVPAGVLDEHVRIGGTYFDLTSGGYILRQLSDGSTELTLTTSYRVSSRPLFYSKIWADMVMRDFHLMILELIKNRSEGMRANHALHPTLDPARLSLPLQAVCVKCG